MRYRNQSYPNTRMVIDGDIEVSGSIVSQELTEALGKAQTAVAQTRNLQQAADISLASIADAASDDVITPLEKLMLKREMANVESEYPVILLQTASSGIEVEDPLYLGFVYRYNRLREYLYGDIYEGPPESVDAPVLASATMGDNYAAEGCGGELRQRFQDYVDARESIRAGITDAAQETKADLEDFKTTMEQEISARAKCFYGATTPGSPYSRGDLWIDDGVLYQSQADRGVGESVDDDWVWCIRSNIITIIESSNGDIFRRGQTQTTMTAHCFRNGLEITNQLSPTQFNWRRSSADAVADELWNMNHQGLGASILITPADIAVRGTIFVDIIEA